MSILGHFMRLHGEKFQVVRDGAVAHIVEGLPNHESATGRKYIGLYSGSDVRPGDWLKRIKTDEEFYVEDARSGPIVRGQVSQLMAYYLTKTEHQQRSGQTRAGHTYHMTFHQPVGSMQAGNGTTAHVAQHIGTGVDDMLRLIAACKGVVPQLPAEQQADAGEALSDLEEELKTESPKPSRMKAFLRNAVVAGKGVAAFTKELIGLATALGFRPEEIGHHILGQ